MEGKNYSMIITHASRVFVAAVDIGVESPLASKVDDTLILSFLHIGEPLHSL